MHASETNSKYVIAGGSGFLGYSLALFLSDMGATPIVLTRRMPKKRGPWLYEPWDGRQVDQWTQVLEGSAGLVNLCGRSVNCIKTPDHQDEILRSRIESTNALGAAMRKLESPPPVWVQMSTAHIYGDPPRVECDEDSATGLGFAPTVGRAWEAAFEANALPSQRCVVLRTGFVLGRDRGAGGGALSTLAGLARWGLGGRVARGKQGMSWIHETDLNRLIWQCLDATAMQGVYVASSPNPLSQVEFMKTLRQTLRVRIGLPAPSWMVRWAAHYLLRTDPELAIYGRYVVSKRLAHEGFEFSFPSLQLALKDLLTA